jgi:hypothetical protein
MSYVQRRASLLRHIAKVAMAASVIGVTGAERVSAQDQWRVAIQAAAIYSGQSSHVLDRVMSPGFPKPGIGGWAPGLVIGAEVLMSRAVGLGVEFGDTGSLDGMQSAGGASSALRRQVRHHDAIVSIPVHYHVRASDRVWLDVMGGLDYVKEQTTTRDATAPPGSAGPFSPYGPEIPLEVNGRRRLRLRSRGGDGATCEHRSNDPRARHRPGEPW